MAFLLAFLAACAFALGSVLQQKGTVETRAGARDPRFLVQILRRPVWLAGLGLQVVGWVLQAFALKEGALMVVQSVTSLSLVVALPLGAKITDQRISRRVIVGAVAMVAGIVVFLLAGSPQGGTSQPDAAAWWTAILATVVVIGLLVGFGRSRTGAVRALLLGSAAGVLFALQAAVTKVFMTQLGHGVAALLGNWTTYALIVSAIAGFVIQQSALRTDVLAPALASSNAVTLFASVVFGLTVFGETLSDGNGRLAPAVIGLILALVGIILLAGAKPPRADQALPAMGMPRPARPRQVHDDPSLQALRACRDVKRIREPGHGGMTCGREIRAGPALQRSARGRDEALRRHRQQPWITRSSLYQHHGPSCNTKFAAVGQRGR